MNNRRQRRQRIYAIIALSGFLLRAFIADGFMLAPTDHGLALELCPARSAELVQLLAKSKAGDHQNHHHEHYHHGQNDGGNSTAAEASSCPYALASATAVQPATPSMSTADKERLEPPQTVSPGILSRTYLRPPSTGPPATFS